MDENSKIQKAKKILDIAEADYKKKLSKEELDFLKSSKHMYDLASTAISDHYDELSHLPKGAGAIFIINGASSILVDTTKGESALKQAFGLLGDAAVTVFSFTPYGRIIMWGNLALSIFDLDASSMFKKIYDSALGDYKGAVLLDNGFLQVTMDDGTIYARPFLPNAHGSLFGGTKDDVLFGGNGNDMLIGHGGKDILIGGAGKDDYFVDNGDTIKDSDGKGRVFYLLQTFNSQVAHK